MRVKCRLHSHSPTLTGKTAVTVTVGYSDTFADPRGCHCNRRSLYKLNFRSLGHPHDLEEAPVVHQLILGPFERSATDSLACYGQLYLLTNLTVSWSTPWPKRNICCSLTWSWPPWQIFFGRVGAHYDPLQSLKVSPRLVQPCRSPYRSKHTISSGLGPYYTTPSLRSGLMLRNLVAAEGVKM